MSDAIKPIEQREINFHEDTVTAVVSADGTVYVPVRPLCELLGISWSTQRRKINDDPVLAKRSMSVFIRTQTSDGDKRPNTSSMIALPLSHLNGWLFSINAKRVKESIRVKLIEYQDNCYNILYEAFTTGVAVRQDDELLQSESPQGSAYRVALAVAKLAREQYYMGKRIDDHETRIGLLEAQHANPSALVTQEQAQQISEAVKAIATVQGKRSGRNEFGAVYGELYRKYGITSYKHLPAARFDHCIDWLRDWWKELTDESDVPF